MQRRGHESRPIADGFLHRTTDHLKGPHGRSDDDHTKTLPNSHHTERRGHRSGLAHRAARDS